MKTTLIRVFTIALAMMFCIGWTAYGNNTSDRKMKRKIILIMKSKDKHIQRDIFADADATYYPDADIIELACDGTKETSVYIVDSKGEEISYDSFDAGMNPYYMVDVPQTPGTYYIVIDSPVLYAEGAFVVE